MKDGLMLNNSYGLDLDTLHEGSRIGIVRLHDNTLHFFLNGQDMGIACTDVPSGKLWREKESVYILIRIWLKEKVQHWLAILLQLVYLLWSKIKIKCSTQESFNLVRRFVMRKMWFKNKIKHLQKKTAIWWLVFFVKWEHRIVLSMIYHLHINFAFG